MAIPMPIVQDIRRLDRQGMSRAQIARRLHVDRGTVAKYADMEDCSPKPKADRRYGSKIDPYAHLVDGWLEADRLLPRKQRHTIRRVHDRLLAETDYDGEYSTTGRYGSITDARGFLTDGTADRSSFARYLRTVGSLTCVFRAIDATDSPFRRKRRIDCTWGMLIIILSGPFWRRYKHHPVKTIPWSACSA